VKELWIEIAESLSEAQKYSLLRSAAQTCDAIIVSAKDTKEARKTGAKIVSTSDESDIKLFSTFDEGGVKESKKTGRIIAVKVTVKGKGDEETVIEAAELSADYIILECMDWKVITLENIIAKTKRKCKLLPIVLSAKEAKLALETLELGADGVVLRNSSLDELIETAIVAKNRPSKIDLVAAKIVELKQIGIGARICVDTCDLMKPGEGFLVGSQSSGLFLVQAEAQENEYVETRPFRVNAGPISLYVLSSLTRTRYLSELKAGDEVLVIDREGKTRTTNVARVKIEWRPMCLVEAEYGQKRIKTIVQNAETVRLVTNAGSKSIAQLEIGDEVLAHIMEGGRHFGMLVEEETVIER
jgi:3-dehydroquinate synthase II